jgi:hypothetical protein
MPELWKRGIDMLGEIVLKLRNAVQWLGVDLGRQDGGVAQAVVLVDPATGEAVGTGASLPVSNVGASIRDASEKYPEASVWNEDAAVTAPGDIVTQAGNTAGAGWIEISKSPFDQGGSTIIEMKRRFKIPVRVSRGLTMSVRAAGNHIASTEIVSTDDWPGAVPVPDPVPVPILNASQTASVITLNFGEAPPVPFRAGQRVNVYGFGVENRFNVSSATVASTPLPTQITIVGNGQNITSTTIGTTLGGGTAFVERVDVLGGSRNGVVVLQENGTPTNISAYTRGEGSLARPSGVLAASHAVTSGTDVAVQLVATPGAHSFTSAVRTRIDLSADGVTVSDRSTSGGNGVYSVRYRHDEVLPNPAREYKLRYRLHSSKAPSRPLKKIISVSKTGSAVATFVTDGPHDLVTGNWLGHYGVSNQTNFAAQTTGVQITVTGPNTFTATTGAIATGTAYGGFVWVSEGQQPLPGAVAQAVISATRVGNVVTLTGSANWSGPLIGELVEGYGIANAVDGASLGLNGTYRVESIATNLLTLSLAGSNTGGPDIAPTACGGAIIRRTSMRVHYTNIEPYDPLLVETVQAGFAEQGYADGVSIVGTPTMSISGNPVLGTGANTIGNINIVNHTAAEDAAAGTTPVIIGGPVRTATAPTSLVAGDAVRMTFSAAGQAVQIPYGVPETHFHYTGTLTTASSVVAQAAAGTGLKRYTRKLTFQGENAVATRMNLLRGTTVICPVNVPANMALPMQLDFEPPLATAANEALNLQCATSGASILVTINGYTGA